MTNDWLQPRACTAAVLVTVAAVKGSVPREPGAKMLVRAGDFAGTIGGGHLEHRALDIARTMLQLGEARRFERFPLGPSLGQCCGGVAWLAFERMEAEQVDILRTRRQQDTWRLVALDGAGEWTLLDEAGRHLAGAVTTPALAAQGGTRVVEDEGGRRWLLDAIPAPRDHLMLFGAGHVGAAIVRALAPLPCRVTWVDERDDLFPSDVPANVTVEATDIPEALVEKAAPGSSFLVMTHSHALDLRLCHAILSRSRGDSCTEWFGLIGSSTKRSQFEARLRERGIDAARIDDMVCPVGMPGIAGKAPAVIAASVAAQLLSVWEAARHPEEQPELS
ncbi:xanthine dehydrogenase accessory protein XdhC [Massilia oculi]|uniref:Xanthine dehydrogenase accessory protein XdhC n=1 Tax=Massilia oculi TaxID=945844 RepID=A0A2S2DHF2_9BURK|nr:xanthine dehydrogenase accessory protein XdhC [Massilia oculi]AWL04509.1 xanthine dehydrogenase accessory protein XdhC [Massilia oculi]